MNRKKKLYGLIAMIALVLAMMGFSVAAVSCNTQNNAIASGEDTANDCVVYDVLTGIGVDTEKAIMAGQVEFIRDDTGAIIDMVPLFE